MDFNNLKKFMDRLTNWRIPGNTIVVYNKDREVFRYSSGYSDVENKIKMTGDELLNIYSSSKIATVVAGLQLYEKGYFLMTDPLYTYIPEYKEMYIKGQDGELKKAKNSITMSQVFSMTAGFSYDINSPAIREVREITNGAMPTVEVAKAIAKEPLLFEPGTRWAYSIGHDVLAAVVEIISGKKFEDYVKENIFGPIGVDDIYYHRNDSIMSRMANQYEFRTGFDDINFVNAQISSGGLDGEWVKVGKEAVYELGPEYDSGGAGIVVSVPDYAKFAAALGNGGAAPNGERILSKGTIDLLCTNQLNEIQLKDFNWIQMSGYGYGLGVRTMIDKAKSGSNGSFGEFGWGGAAGANMLVDPQIGISCFYSHHMLNPQEDYYQPRLRNVIYSCIN